MSNFYPSSISCLTHFVTTIVIKVWYNEICLDFSQDFQILFLPVQFKKNHERNLKKTIFC